MRVANRMVRAGRLRLYPFVYWLLLMEHMMSYVEELEMEFNANANSPLALSRT